MGKFANSLKEYKGLWVALNEKEEVVASAMHAKEALEISQKKGNRSPTMFRVPTEYPL